MILVYDGIIGDIYIFVALGIPLDELRKASREELDAYKKIRKNSN